MTSTWMRSAPAASASFTCSASRPASADRMDGTISIRIFPIYGEVPGVAGGWGFTDPRRPGRSTIVREKFDDFRVQVRALVRTQLGRDPVDRRRQDAVEQHLFRHPVVALRVQWRHASLVA